MCTAIGVGGGIRLEWDAQHHILCVYFDRDWDTTRYFEMVEQANTFVRAQPGRVNAILCYTESGLSPRLDVFSTGRETLRLLPDNIDTVIVVDSRRSTQVIMQAFARVFPFQMPHKKVRLLVADTMAAAYAILLEA